MGLGGHQGPMPVWGLQGAVLEPPPLGSTVQSQHHEPTSTPMGTPVPQVSLGLLCIPVGRWAGPCCPSRGRLTRHPACQGPQGQPSRGHGGKGPGSRRYQGGKPTRAGLRDCQGLPGTWGAWLPQGRESSRACPRPALSSTWVVSPTICGHSSTGVLQVLPHSSLGTPTLGTAAGWQRKEGARHRQQVPGSQLSSSNPGYQ